MTTEHTSLANCFLVATPSLQDPHFHHAVTYIFEHSEDGAMGIVINHPMSLTLGDILNQLDIHTDDPLVSQHPVFVGGPVQQDRGFVLHTPGRHWQSTLETTDAISITTSSDILEDIANADGPDQAIVSLGYAGWAAGQLEEEISNNYWLWTPADAAVLFETPHEQRWEAAAALIGIDMAHLSGESGHA